VVKRLLLSAIAVLAVSGGALALLFGLASAEPVYVAPPSPTASGVTLQWYWQISAPVTERQITAGTTATANIWDTDEFEDANSTGANGDPNGPSTIVGDLHAANKYSICYVEAGAFQQGFPDNGNFSSIDYTDPGQTARCLT
jgi:Glycoside-hydrolase family GH114